MLILLILAWEFACEMKTAFHENFTIHLGNSTSKEDFGPTETNGARFTTEPVV